jgi:hypothetical protein
VRSFRSHALGFLNTLKRGCYGLHSSLSTTAYCTPVGPYCRSQMTRTHQLTSVPLSDKAILRQ